MTIGVAMFFKMIKGTFAIFTMVGIALVVAFIYAYTQISLDARTLIDYKPDASTLVLDKNGKTIGYIFKEHHRLYATYDEMPRSLIEALIAIEDTRFFEHNGVSPDAIIRAVFKDIKAGSFVEGGSTITQQLVKNKLLTSEKTIGRKVKEAVLAMKIEDELTKEQILERYLNEIFFGNGYYGVKTAARGFFHKELKELTLKEVAILVGLPNSPSALNPVKHYDKSLNRANSVLYRLKTLGWIKDDVYFAAIKETPTVYDTPLAQNLAPYITDEVVRQYGKEIEDLQTGGYTVYTTIDLKQQKIAEESVEKAYENAMRMSPSSSLNSALISIDSSTGSILAMVGGVDYAKSAFNRATQAKRQPGSSFKPFIYQIALDSGLSPSTQVSDEPIEFAYTDASGNKKIWKPQNYHGESSRGSISIRDALIKSSNLATVNMLNTIGLKNVRSKLGSLGIENIPDDMSISLGNLSVSPMQMAKIYTIFSNGGKIMEPVLVSKIIDRDGKIVFRSSNETKMVFTSPDQAYLMTNILQDVVRRGTGTGASVGGIELAGKTGTTNNSVDAWFCGYSPTVETVIWVGRDDNKPMSRNITGGSVAAPAFASYYQKLIRLYPRTKRFFTIPDGVESINGEVGTQRSPIPDFIIHPPVQEVVEGNTTDTTDTNQETNSTEAVPSEGSNNPLSILDHFNNLKE